MGNKCMSQRPQKDNHFCRTYTKSHTALPPSPCRIATSLILSAQDPMKAPFYSIRASFWLYKSGLPSFYLPVVEYRRLLFKCPSWKLSSDRVYALYNLPWPNTNRMNQMGEGWQCRTLTGLLLALGRSCNCPEGGPDTL